ncbi:MAG: BamA/TamA family outer membrane protein [Candidatus Lambdaproteobacteria bacterium]|nr:BamA/TamA family outer membrane protein [Candidatus Lambdaproteobacteria bacterium]
MPARTERAEALRASLRAPGAAASGRSRPIAPGWLLLSIAMYALVPQALAQSIPDYRIDVHLDGSGRAIFGSIDVRVAENDARPRGTWWFHLPPNRFLESDPRGPRRNMESIPFGRSFVTPEQGDPLLPEGFSFGMIEIFAVTDDDGRLLRHTYWANPLLPEGYSIRDGLLRVEFTPGTTGRAVRIFFRTTLPERYWDGWNTTGVFAEHWHPALLNFRDGEWVRDPADPTPGKFAGKIQADRAGWLVAGRGPALQLEEGGRLMLPDNPLPMRSLPFVHIDSMELQESTFDGIRLRSFYRNGNRRVSNLARDVAEEFLLFMRERYGLDLPMPELTFVEIDSHPGDIRVAGQIIVIPTLYYVNNRIIDRVFVGKLSQALAQIWFGQEVWANSDRQAWLPLGMGGFLSLDFYAYLYGWDAGIHGLMDWLNPRYREHYFEQAVRGQIATSEDAPLMVSLSQYPHFRSALISLFQKAPLVVRALSHIVGEERFRRGIREFYRRYRYRAATEQGFEQVMTEVAGVPIDWFIAEWFYGTPRVDYALAGWSQRPRDGSTLVEVRVERREAGIMPVDVEVTAVTGETLMQRWDGKEQAATLRFVLAGPVERIVLDPGEYLLETDRQNNRSDTLIRFRPFFDWQKQREKLILLRGSLGGNAIDGNFVGLGATALIDEDNEVRLIPGYGQESERLLYEAGWVRKRFLFERLSLDLNAEQIGGRVSRGAALYFRHPTPEAFFVQTGIAANVEHVEAARADRLTSTIQRPGRSGNWELSNETSYRGGEKYFGRFTLSYEHSAQALDADFNYGSLRLAFAQTFTLGPRHVIKFDLIRGLTDGDAPIQKRHLLGDPTVLRGYPRDVALVNDQIAAMRFEYQYIVTRRIIGTALQSRRISGIFSVDAGKGWNNDENPYRAPQRQDVGVGIGFDVDVLSHVAFPLRFEVSIPFNDRQYQQERFIFFEALTFF